MKKIGFTIISLTVAILFLLGCLLLNGCSRDKNVLSLRTLLEKYLAKDVSISMWDSDRSKAVTEIFILAEANEDYIVVKQQGEKETAIAIPFSNITNIVMSETPPEIVLNDQIMLTGLGETIDNLGYVGSRIERLRPSSTKTE